MTQSQSAAGAVLCRFEALPEGRPHEARLGQGDAAGSVILFRQGETVCAYRNRCPHFQIPLNARPEVFLSPGEGLIMCAFHSAVFRIADGLCVDGPCKGARLEPFPVRRDGADVVAA